MEVSMIGNSQAKLGRSDLASRENLSRMILPRKSMISFGQAVAWPKSSSVRFTLKAESVVSDKVAGNSLTTRRRSKPDDAVNIYVGLPLDAISDCNRITHERAIAVGLKALKLLGVTGVELPVWWGIAEKESMGKYDWSAYLALAEMVEKAGLKLHVSLCFHGSSEELKIPLPQWVSQIGESQPDIFFADRSGKRYKDCLSFAVDDLPVLNGKTPIQVYTEFCESFKSTFSPFMESTITGISIGLGPNGELRYPSHHHNTKTQKVPGTGEFQCYDENMLNNLKEHAQILGNPLWGRSGPHDVPSYDQPPNSANFFKDHGGSWETPYGDFFLSWYSGLLVSHGDRVLSLAASTFADTPVTVAGKVALMHSWYRTRSHASEMTGGYYNADGRDGYDAVAEIFGRNSCKMILPGMDLADEGLSSPELLIDQIATACEKHKVDICGQNSSVVSGGRGFEQIKKYVLGMDLFTYQRMGASLFSPQHFPLFTEFVRSVNNQLEIRHSDDLAPTESTALGPESSKKNLQMQAA